MSIKKILWVFVIAAPLFALFLVSLQFYYVLEVWQYDGPDASFKIKSGEAFSSINSKLYKNKYIKSAKVFYRYSKYKSILTSFKAGNHLIASGSTMKDVIATLQTGGMDLASVTIPEGKNIYQVADILAAKKIVKKESFLEYVKSDKSKARHKITGQSLEGYLYPDTYYLSKESPVSIVVDAMIKQFDKKTKDLNFSTAPLNLKKSEVITLASVVEKETGAAWERAKIAGVFINRLKKRMRLQSDPTTIYGIYENFNGNLRKRHLLEMTPYNTYKIPALPIGPIANPGIKAIQAVLKPDSHSFLYFVSKNDGTHVFSKTYKDHKKAVQYWQVNRQNRAGKSWRDLKKKK